MRTRARLLNVIAIAPVAALAAASLGPIAHAQTASSPPQPIVVAIDPGHGGSASAANPSQLFDPGAIAANGVEEKNVTLDVGRRLAALLAADDVDAVLTRTSDVYLTIPQREQVVAVSFAVVAFSVFVQGLTMTPFLRRMGEIPG